MRGIPTMHGGTRYRSLLEAKWAAFFTRLGWEYEYEPFEGNGYIPDFAIYGPAPLIIEVKPAVTWPDLYAHTQKVAQGLDGIWQSDILIVGASPIRLRATQLAAGLLGESCLTPDGNVGWDWAPGNWFYCLECDNNEINVYHDNMSFHGRPCNHYSGDHHLGHIVEPDLERIWKRACNEVQWRGNNQ